MLTHVELTYLLTTGNTVNIEIVTDVHIVKKF